ncbi:hypothetical protein EYF80_055392 [Liparis tanakae]|uniref:Uncharacterized protein n=1 Tax=Liparis tanakae TaxID=230148 RepID=A0A4Z2F002_9TELE|nr:hypothetical protein EYF80_055392 [Liparis tanakae]
MKSRGAKWTLAYNDAGGPGVEQEDGADQEGAGQHHADGQQEPVAQPDVLLPEQEGVSVGVVQHAFAAKLVANGANALDGFHEVAGLAEAVQDVIYSDVISCWIRRLTAQVLPRGVVLVVDPLPGVGVEVGLGGGEAQRIVTDPDGQVDVEHLRGDQTLGIHQASRCQLEEGFNCWGQIDPGVNMLVDVKVELEVVPVAPPTYLAVTERLLLGAGLDEQLVGQRSVLRAVAIAVRGNPAGLPHILSPPYDNTARQEPTYNMLRVTKCPVLLRASSTHLSSVSWLLFTRPPRISSSCQCMNFRLKPWQPPWRRPAMSGL